MSDVFPVEGEWTIDIDAYMTHMTWATAVKSYKPNKLHHYQLGLPMTHFRRRSGMYSSQILYISATKKGRGLSHAVYWVCFAGECGLTELARWRALLYVPYGGVSILMEKPNRESWHTLIPFPIMCQHRDHRSNNCKRSIGGVAES